MKKLILFSLCGLLVNYAFAQKNELTTSLENMNLKGKVKSIREKTYNVIEKDGQWAKGQMQTYSYGNSYMLFDKEGNDLETTYYNADGTEASKFEYTWIKPGLHSMMKESRNGKLHMTTLKEYDKNDYVIKEKKLNSDGSINTEMSYKYNQMDKKKKSYDIIAGGKIETYTTTVNKDGTETYETRTGNEVYYSRATFDDKKQIIKLEDTDANGKPNGTTYNSEFDKGGNETKSETIYKTGKPSVTINEYDYDTKGNWIVKREKTDYGKKIVEREIVYW